MFGTTRSSSATGILVTVLKKDNIAQKTYTTFNPINLVENGTPIPLFEEKILVQ
jgi:hypothetical protein